MMGCRIPDPTYTALVRGVRDLRNVLVDPDKVTIAVYKDITQFFRSVKKGSKKFRIIIEKTGLTPVFGAGVGAGIGAGIGAGNGTGTGAGIGSDTMFPNRLGKILNLASIKKFEKLIGLNTGKNLNFELWNSYWNAGGLANKMREFIFKFSGNSYLNSQIIC
jgi:hypothetical protein